MTIRSIVVGVVLLLEASIGVQAGEGERQSASVADYVSADGSIDMESIRSSGFKGNLDLNGFDLGLDPQTGRPILRPTGASQAQADPDDIYWDNSMSPSILGVDSAVYAMAAFEGKLVIGGEFTIAGNVIISNIAAWDGTSWTSLGSGMDGEVTALTVYDGKLIAGGWFTDAGGSEAAYIAAWDGSSWAPLGSGLSEMVEALLVYDGELIAGGWFAEAGGVSASQIASWDGSNWSPLGLASNRSGTVFALTEYDGKLAAGGSFWLYNPDAGTTWGIGQWDGSQWLPLKSGMWDSSSPGVVRTLHTYEGRLVAAGRFDQAGDANVSHIAAWDGSGWESLGLGLNGDYAYAYELTTFEDQLIVGGSFDQAGQVYARNVASWDGFNWSEMGQGISGFQTMVRALLPYGTELWAGGVFTQADARSAHNLASWDGANWSAVCDGISGFVHALAIIGDQLIAGGRFSTKWTVYDDVYLDVSDGIMRWNDSVWEPIGGGIIFGTVNDIVVYRGDLIAGGLFDFAGGVPASNIARWDGVEWSALGSGTYADGANPGDVNVLTVLWDTLLIAGGWFDSAGGVAARHIAAWNGSIWSSLGVGVNDYVWALAEYGDELIVGGYFDTAGGVSANRVAAWDGSAWRALGSGMDYSVGALAVFENRLVAGGSFTLAGGTPASRIAVWDSSGSFWSPLGNGVSDDIRDILTYGNKLFACGGFETAGGGNAAYIASWDGSHWESLGSGLDESADALCVFDNSVMVGGAFNVAGGKAANAIAQWTKHESCCLPPTVGDCDQSGTVDITDLSVMIDNQFLSLAPLICDAEGDVDFSGEVDITDLSVMIDNQFLTLTPLSPCP